MADKLREQIESMPAWKLDNVEWVQRSAVLALLAERGATTREPSLAPTLDEIKAAYQRIWLPEGEAVWPRTPFELFDTGYRAALNREPKGKT